MRGKSESLSKPIVRAVLLGVLTIFFTISISIIGNWDKTQPYFIWKILFVAATACAYVFFTGYYAKIDVNQRRSYSVLQNQLEAFEDLVASIVSICNTTSTDVNKCIHRINEENLMDLNIWNYESACRNICIHIYNNICRLSAGRKYGVAYVALIEGTEKENEIKMIAYANQDQHKPSIFQVNRRFKETNLDNAYHDVQLFHEGRSDIEILVGVEEVNKVFAYSSRARRNENMGKYHLYIGIPVFCADKKMIGLLEVVGLDKTYFNCKTKEEIEEFVYKFLAPYSKVFLLLHKMEKALLAGTQNKK